jgi:hypothetical protein
MKVKSPVGDFPFAIERIALESRRLVLYGRMGAWPSRVELEGADLLTLGRHALVSPLLGALSSSLLGRKWRKERPSGARSPDVRRPDALPKADGRDSNAESGTNAGFRVRR